MMTEALCQKYSVSKYPTIKLLRDGVPMKKEYRGQRTAEAITQYIRDQLKSPVTEVKNLDEIYELNVSVFLYLNLSLGLFQLF